MHARPKGGKRGGQALGLLVALTLRNPSAAEKAVAMGCVDSVVDVMSQIDTNAKDPRQAQWVQRQVGSDPLPPLCVSLSLSLSPPLSPRHRSLLTPAVDICAPFARY